MGIRTAVTLAVTTTTAVATPTIITDALNQGGGCGGRCPGCAARVRRYDPLDGGSHFPLLSLLGYGLGPIRGSKILKFLSGAVALVTAISSGALVQNAPPDNSFLSRMTIGIPFFTQHYPDDRDFNDHNWGGFLFLRSTIIFRWPEEIFVNSYKRNTAFAAVSVTPWNIDVGLDLNGGYRG
jgi:hypothetical protein